MFYNLLYINLVQEFSQFEEIKKKISFQMNKNILTCTQLFVCYDSNLISSFLHSEYMYIERTNLPAFPVVFSFALGPPPFVSGFLLSVGLSPIKSFQTKLIYNK